MCAMVVLNKTQRDYATKLFDEAMKDTHILSERAKRMTINMIGECLMPGDSTYAPLDHWARLVAVTMFYMGYQDALIKEGLFLGIEREK